MRGVSSINRRSFLAELRSLLSFMDPADRQMVLRKYESMFDEAGPDGEEALIARFGSPVRQVLRIERQYRESLRRREEAMAAPDAQEAPSVSEMDLEPEAEEGGEDAEEEIDLFAPEEPETVPEVPEESEAEAERMAAREDIRAQIADVSAAIAEKLLEREINSSDKEKLIDDFIDGVGDEK